MSDISILSEWLRCIYIIVAGILLQQLLSRFIFPWIEQRLEKRHVSLKIKNILFVSIRRPIEFLILMTAFYVALHNSPLELFSPEIFLAIYRSTIIVSFFAILYNLADSDDGQLEKLMKRINIHLDPILINLLGSTLRVLIAVICFLTLAREWGFDISGLLAGLGIGGLALAMASKDSLANIFGGFIILTDKPFSIGDWIQYDNVEGTVEKLSFRSTRVRTVEQGVVYIPNSTLANASITNMSRRRKRRHQFILGLHYDTPKKNVQNFVENLKNYLQNCQGISHAQGDIMVFFLDYAESAFNIQITYFTITTSLFEYYALREKINFDILTMMEESGVSLAYPTQSIFLTNK